MKFIKGLKLDLKMMVKIFLLTEVGQMRDAVGLIPTRFNSRRLPGKSLKMIGSIREKDFENLYLTIFFLCQVLQKELATI